MNINITEKEAIMLCIPRVTGSNLGPDTGYFVWGYLFFHNSSGN